MRLRFVRLFQGEQRLEAIVEVDGKNRKVNYRWKARVKSDVPPEDWLDLVMEEIRQQRVRSESKIQWFAKKPR